MGAEGQPTAPNVPAAAMKSILPEVRRVEGGKSRQGRAGAGAAEGRDSGVRTGGRELTGKGGKGQAGESGPAMRQGTKKGKGEKGRAGATVAAAPTLVPAAAARVAPTGQHGGAGGGGERGVPPADGSVRGAGAHGAPAPSPPGPEVWA